MKKIRHSIIINAPREKVYQAIVDPTLYPLWAESFFPESTFIGSWDQGAKISFVGPSEQGATDGMFSEIVENRPNEYISIKHIGEIRNGVEDSTSEDVKKWLPAYENYTFEDADGGTKFTIEMETTTEMYELFDPMWPPALERLREVAETGTSHLISIVAFVRAPMDVVWRAYNEPKHITQWAFASPEWECPAAESDLRVGGRFSTTMAARDKSASFDLTGTFTNVIEREVVEYDMDGDDHRHVCTTFQQRDKSVQVTITFEIEHQNPREMQRGGWQAILNNFKTHCEKI